MLSICSLLWVHVFLGAWLRKGWGFIHYIILKSDSLVPRSSSISGFNYICDTTSDVKSKAKQTSRMCFLNQSMNEKVPKILNRVLRHVYHRQRWAVSHPPAHACYVWTVWSTVFLMLNTAVWSKSRASEIRTPWPHQSVIPFTRRSQGGHGNGLCFQGNRGGLWWQGHLPRLQLQAS